MFSVPRICDIYSFNYKSKWLGCYQHLKFTCNPKFPFLNKIATICAIQAVKVYLYIFI